MSFSVYGPWDAPRAISDPPRTTAVAVKETIDALVGIVSTIAGIVLAWRNVRRGRGDRRGAMRVAALGFCTSLLALLFRADHRSLLDGEWDGVVRIAAGKSLYTAALLWVLYVALEPIVRRRWPNMLISCTRLISGRFRDPMVGRDLLAGTIAGLLVTILGTAAHVAPAWFGGSIVPMQSATSPFASIRHVLFFVLNNIGDAAVTAIFVVTILVIIRAVVRNRTLAVVGLFLLCMIALATPDLPVAFTLIPAAMSAAVIVFALLRFGVLSVFAAAYVAGVVQSLPIVLDPSAWYFGRSLLAMSLLGGLALYGAIIAIGRKPLFGAPLFDEE
jgi:hypothetical protein